MKRGIFLLMLITTLTHLSAQNTVRIDHIPRHFKANKHILMLFEQLDTADASGRKFTISRSYYFDEKNRMISAVQEFENQVDPDMGTRVTYTFDQSRLAKVTVLPSKVQCRKCESQYYFVGDTLLLKKEISYKSSNPDSFVLQAQYFKMQLPAQLPWGHFQNEVFRNGKRKTIRIRN